MKNESIYNLGEKYGSMVDLIDTAGYELGKNDEYYNDINRTVSNSINEEVIYIIWYGIPVVNE